VKAKDLTKVQTDMRRYPPVLNTAFENTQGEVAELLTDIQHLRWAQEGLRIAQRTARAWEAAAEYYRASARVLHVLNFTQFIHWAETGSSLSSDSPTVSAAFFRSSPLVLPNLAPRHITGWTELGKSLSRGTWKSSSLAARFFDISPDLMRQLSFRDLQMFVALVEALSYRSYDLAAECLHLGQRVLPTVEERQELISLANALVESSWREVRGVFEAASKISDALDPQQRGPFIALTERLARRGMTNISGFLLETSQAMAKIEPSAHGRMLKRSESLSEFPPEAVGAFLKSLPLIMERISESQIDTWFAEGVKLLYENPDAGVAYFRLESTKAEQVLDSLSSSIELEKVKAILGLYCTALAGTEVTLLPAQDLPGRHLGWVSAEKASTDGSHIYLPPVVDGQGPKEDNFSWLKVVATHQLGHLEFNSFSLAINADSTQFDDLRPELVARAQSGQDTAPFTIDMSHFFGLFSNRQLADDIFSALEDARIDSLTQRRYLGLAPFYHRVLMAALEKRPPIEAMPLQTAMVELMVRLSLDPAQAVPVPLEQAEDARQLAGLVKVVQNPLTTVEDTAEATIRAYAIISGMVNEEVPPDDWQEQDFEGAEFQEGDRQQVMEQMTSGGQQDRADEDAGEEYESPEDVDFRGEFKPEIVQLLSRIRGTEVAEEEAATEALSQEALEELLRASSELEFEDDGEVTSMANNLMKEQGINLPQTQPGSGHQDIPHQDETGNPLEVNEPRSYLYDEWDFRANDYRPRWCVVQEKQVLTGETRFFSDTLSTHAGLMNEIRRQFEAVRPEMYRKVKHLPEGEDVDLDSGIDALIDIRSGVSPNEEIYWRRNKAERDVGVVFLLDMSASTAEAVEEAKREPEWDVPSDPTAYAAWLRTRRGEGNRRQYKRIIDVEKESMVLLMTALDTIGDRYGVYGFSGFGRENVEFYVIKEVDEPLTDLVKRRLDKVSPLHATRMGPAIRHATTKLEAVQAKTKFLFVISDGRPQDRGYSREGVEKEYAVQDTRMALLESRRKGITPFCLTVDRQGHDYLRTMAGDMGYEVLPDIMDLPRRLPYLYRRLTV
jgi:nitric oxide reductase NorD protein